MDFDRLYQWLTFNRMLEAVKALGFADCEFEGAGLGRVRIQ